MSRKGRDLVTLRRDKDGVLVSFADNPKGSDHYEIEIAFGDQPRVEHDVKAGSRRDTEFSRPL